jgi:hypothetical protein
MGSVDFPEIAVEGAERAVARFARDLHHEAVGEADCRTTTKLIDGGADGFRVLQRQLLMIQEHLDCRGNSLRTAIVDGGEHPRGFGEREMRHPGAGGDEGLGCRNLFDIVSGYEPNQHIGVNGSHVAS